MLNRLRTAIAIRRFRREIDESLAATVFFWKLTVR